MLDSIEELLSRQPFEAFLIVTASGDKYEVRNRHLVALGKTQINYFFSEVGSLVVHSVESDYGAGVGG